MDFDKINIPCIPIALKAVLKHVMENEGMSLIDALVDLEDKYTPDVTGNHIGTRGRHLRIMRTILSGVGAFRPATPKDEVDGEWDFRLSGRAYRFKSINIGELPELVSEIKTGDWISENSDWERVEGVNVGDDFITIGTKRKEIKLDPDEYILKVQNMDGKGE